MTISDQYRNTARTCLWMAVVGPNEPDRLGWIKLAEAWIRRARELDDWQRTAKDWRSSPDFIIEVFSSDWP